VCVCVRMLLEISVLISRNKVFYIWKLGVQQECSSVFWWLARCYCFMFRNRDVASYHSWENTLLAESFLPWTEFLNQFSLFSPCCTEVIC
jgi:hypothetical protein